MELFNQIFELIKAGNYGGAWTMFLGCASTLIATCGGVYGIIALINKGISLMTGNKKLLKRMKETTETAVEPLGQAVNEFKNAVDKTLANLNDSLTNEFKGEINDIQKLITELNNKYTAFAGTVLNDEKLSLKYENILNKIKLNAKQELPEIVEKSEELKEDTEKVVEDIEEIKEIVIEKAKKPKKKKADIEYV